MKKVLSIAALLFVVISFTSCEVEDPNEQEQTEAYATGKDDSTNSGGGDNPAPDNGEE